MARLRWHATRRSLQIAARSSTVFGRLPTAGTSNWWDSRRSLSSELETKAVSNFVFRIWSRRMFIWSQWCAWSLGFRRKVGTAPSFLVAKPRVPVAKCDYAPGFSSPVSEISEWPRSFWSWKMTSQRALFLAICNWSPTPILKRQCHDNRWFLATILCGENNGGHKARPRENDKCSRKTTFARLSSGGEVVRAGDRAVIREVRWVQFPGSDRTPVSPVRTEPDGPQKRLGES